MKRTATMLSGLLLVGALATPAVAGHDKNPSGQVRTYAYDLNEVADNDRDGEPEGTVRLTALPNGKIQVKVQASGLTPNQPHAQHIHAADTDEDGTLNQGMCPTIDADANGDGFVDTAEGGPAYGGVQQSLTTTGDTSAASALELGRFPVADADGVLEYNRTFTPDSEDFDIHADLGNVEIVVHGIDLDDSGDYSNADGLTSSLADVPLDATIPVLCGGPQG